MTSSSSTQLTELSRLNTSSGFLWKRNFLERRGTKESACDVSRDFFRSSWVFLDQPSVWLLGWPFYTCPMALSDLQSLLQVRLSFMLASVMIAFSYVWIIKG